MSARLPLRFSLRLRLALLGGAMLLLGALAAPPLHAQETLWAGLVYASSEKTPAPPPGPLSEFGKKIESVFHYNQVELVRERRATLTDATEKTLALGKTFRLCATRKSAHDGKTLFNLRLFQKDRLLVQTEAKLGRLSPLFLSGPLCDKGRLIIVLQVE